MENGTVYEMVTTPQKAGNGNIWFAKEAPQIELNKKKATLYRTQKIQLKATVKGSLTKVTWESDKPAVASVDANGNVTAKKAGSATITAKLNGKSASCKITVQNASVNITSTKVSLYTGQTKKLKATVKGKGLSATWKSSDPSIASVNSVGKITAKKKGTVTITASIRGLESIKDTCTVEVKAPSIKLNKSNDTLNLTDKKSVQLTASVQGASQKVTWKSSNKKVATVNAKGKVTAKKTGTVTITARANGVAASCKITVEKESALAIAKKDLGQWVASYAQFYNKFEVVDLIGDSTPEVLLMDAMDVGTITLLYYDPTRPKSGIQYTRTDSICQDAEEIYIDRKTNQIVVVEVQDEWEPNRRKVTLYDSDWKAQKCYMLEQYSSSDKAYFASRSGDWTYHSVTVSKFWEMYNKWISIGVKYTYKDVTIPNTAANRAKYLGYTFS